MKTSAQPGAYSALRRAMVPLRAGQSVEWDNGDWYRDQHYAYTIARRLGIRVQAFKVPNRGLSVKVLWHPSDLMNTCFICRTTPTMANHIGACAKCQPVWRICCTSVQEAVSYELPKASMEDLIAALAYEMAKYKRGTLIRAIERRMRVLERQRAAEQVIFCPGGTVLIGGGGGGGSGRKRQAGMIRPGLMLLLSAGVVSILGVTHPDRQMIWNAVWPVLAMGSAILLSCFAILVSAIAADSRHDPERDATADATSDGRSTGTPESWGCE